MNTNQTAWISEISTKYKKRSNTRIVLDTLEDAILNKNLLPGDALPSETVLAASLSVGKSSVREAIKMLEAIGVVNVVQGKGSFICENFDESTSNILAFQLILAERSPKELIEFRYLFEPMYMKLALQKMTEENLKTLLDHMTHFEEKVKNGTQSPEDDIWFHKFLLSMTDNTLITNVGVVLSKMLKKRTAKVMLSQPNIVLDDHKAICAALVARDEKNLNEAIKNSLDNWVKINYGDDFFSS